MEEAKKRCFKCGLELPLSMFYAHPQTADGHLNKCKSCTKKDVHENYEKKINDDDFVEKQRARGREKYKRLEYGKKYKRKKHLSKTSSCRRKFERRFGKIPLNIELHHWNYNELEDVIPLDRKVHHRLHNLIQIDEKAKIFLIKETKELLDTKEKHLNFIKEKFGNIPA